LVAYCRCTSPFIISSIAKIYLNLSHKYPYLVDHYSIELAKKKGIYKGRKRSLSSEKVAVLNGRANAGNNKSELVKEFGGPESRSCFPVWHPVSEGRLFECCVNN
jgi:hypothetical protein